MNSCADRPTLAPFAPVDLGGQHAYKLTDDEERGADRVRSDPGETPESGETGVLGKENAQEVSGGTGQQEHQYRLFSADPAKDRDVGCGSSVLFPDSKRGHLK